MSLNNQPVRGIIPVLCVTISSIIVIGIGQGTFSINPDMLSVYALFFIWTAYQSSGLNQSSKRAESVV